MIEEFEKEFWKQYPIDQFVRIDGDLIVGMLKEVDSLQRYYDDHETRDE